jgi:sulfhydrogenase subunit gamma (sulfur reductase)
VADTDTRSRDFEEKAFYRPQLARVAAIERLTDTEVLLKLQMADGRPLEHHPGQFVQTSVFGFGEAPFSICSSPTRSDLGFELCVRRVGTVSHALHRLAVNDWVGIRGPYGRGFPLKAFQGRDVLIVAGGVGLAPLRGLIGFLLDRRERYGRLTVIYGARSPSMLLFRNDLEEWSARSGLELQLIVDQPDETWQGPTGVVTQLLRDLDIEPDRTYAAVVGPPVLFRFAARELMEKGLEGDRIFFSLERHFKCGIGKCGHCQLNDLYVCQDGPVFRYTDLLGRTEAIEAWAPENDQD